MGDPSLSLKLSGVPLSLPISDVVKKYTLAQSATEIALGSLIHAFRIPLGGHLLSLNQSILLTLATRNAKNRRQAISIVSQIANSTAALKSLSPMGSRIKPMLAISTQGLLFSLSQWVFGPSFIGVVCGSALASFWAFAQPVLLASLIFGSVFFESIEKLWREISVSLHLNAAWGIYLLIGMALFKMSVASVLSAIAWNSGTRFEEKYLSKIEFWSKRTRVTRIKCEMDSKSKTPLLSALKDLLNPWFLTSAIVTCSFFIAIKNPSSSQILLYLLRIFGGTLLVSWAVRAISSPSILSRINPQLSLAEYSQKNSKQNLDIESTQQQR